MKVLALGGAGGMGRHAVKTLLEMGFCSEIVIADINGKIAEAFSMECGKGTSWKIVDVSDPLSLKTSMKDADVVINTTGPYYKFGITVLNAAIESGCHYFDINDDWEPTLDMLELNEKARKAGVVAIIGMGATPGISNLLAVKALRELDEPLEVYTGWNLDSAKPDTIGQETSAATIHGIHQLTGMICTFDGGRFQKVRPRQKVILDYPGIGINRVWTIGHPEAVTLPRYYPSLQKSSNVFTTSGFNITGINIIAKLVDLKIISISTAARVGEMMHGAYEAENTPQKIYKRMTGKKNRDFPPIFVLVKGIKNNKPSTVASMMLSFSEEGMGGATGIPLAVAVSLLNDKKIVKHGVFAPEGILEPDDFFEKLAPFCKMPWLKKDDLILTTRSWERNRLSEILSKRF